jgi:N-dimethylarginine dimethylaminohydrolase
MMRRLRVTLAGVSIAAPTAQPSAAASPAPTRRASRRTVLMCRPDHFTVSYRINPWMDPSRPTSTSLAVELIDPLPGLPDMVYAANGGFVLDGVAYGAKFTYPERQPEGPAYMEWFRQAGLRVAEPVEVNEGEGDFLLVGDVILAGTGFRSASDSHAELARVTGREVVGLTLVDPRFYHLDTAVAVLDPEPVDGGAQNIAYLESAFDEPSLAVLRERFPDAVLVSDDDATILGLNSYSDGLHVVIAEKATGFARQLRERGYEPVGVDLSELLLGGGGVKCCTLELRR